MAVRSPANRGLWPPVPNDNFAVAHCRESFRTPAPDYGLAVAADQYFAETVEASLVPAGTRQRADDESKEDFESLLDDIAPEIVENTANLL